MTDLLQQQTYHTSRLVLEPVAEADADFILELVNQPDWIRFIGDKQLHAKEEAQAYIQKMRANPKVNYWVVKLKDGGASLGVVTYIQRDYLEYPDIGFAFLPAYRQQGYAYEASRALLEQILKEASFPYILATAMKDNRKSIQLLKKMGFRFDKEIGADGETLLLFTLPTPQLRLDG